MKIFLILSEIMNVYILLKLKKVTLYTYIEHYNLEHNNQKSTISFILYQITNPSYNKYLFSNSQLKLQRLTMESSFTTELNTIKQTYNTLLKRKQDISEKINMYKCKGKMFPPLVKQSYTKSIQSQVVNDRSLATPATPQDESEESWTINDEPLTYNMEFNVEPKKLTFSKQSLSRLTKQSSHYDSFENVDKGYKTKKWTTYYDDEVIPPIEDVEDCRI